MLSRWHLMYNTCIFFKKCMVHGNIEEHLCILENSIAMMIIFILEKLYLTNEEHLSLIISMKFLKLEPYFLHSLLHIHSVHLGRPICVNFWSCLLKLRVVEAKEGDMCRVFIEYYVRLSLGKNFFLTL